MKANNLTICVEAGCEKNCPYCISKMTFAPDPDRATFIRNIKKARFLAEQAQVSSVLITSKGEPLNNFSAIEFVGKIFKRFPLELQTNGMGISEESTVAALSDANINTIAISLDGPGDSADGHVRISNLHLERILNWSHMYGISTRLTIILSDLAMDLDLNKLLTFAIKYKVSQLTFRKVTAPRNVVARSSGIETSNWIRNNTSFAFAKLFEDLKYYQTEDNLIRKLPWGATVYDAAGISITTIDYCIQEANNYDDIRSLIYHQDGHMYTSWDKPSSILF